MTAGLVATLVNPAFLSSLSAWPVVRPTSPEGIVTFAGPVLNLTLKVLSDALLAADRHR